MNFSKCFVINLPFKRDRLKKFLSTVPQCLGPIDVWPAVHGEVAQVPEWWSAGKPAWGCYQSHLQILEHCHRSGIESYAVFEDDAIWRCPFDDLFDEFVGALPSDWQQVYLGGQLIRSARRPPVMINANVYAPFNVHRAHAYAVHQRGYKALLKHLTEVPFQPKEHIDHHFGRLHESGTFKVYCPPKWLVGQDGGHSDISSLTNPPTFWADPERVAEIRRNWNPRSIACVVLDATDRVAQQLERRGWKALRDGRDTEEAAINGSKCVFVMAKDVATNESTDWIHISATTADEADWKLAEAVLPQCDLEEIPTFPGAPCFEALQ